VKTHVARVLSKLELRDRAQAVVIAHVVLPRATTRVRERVQTRANPVLLWQRKRLQIV